MNPTITALDPLSELTTRALASDSDRKTWLEARTNCVTATQAKLLSRAKNPTSRKAVRNSIVKTKLEGEQFGGNFATQWGQLREPHIIQEINNHPIIREHLDDAANLNECGLLIHATGMPRHAATPDAIALTKTHNILIAEIKTANQELTPGTPEFERTGYYEQVQWQMYCVGTDLAFIAVEVHDNDWSDWEESSREDRKMENGPAIVSLNVYPVLRDQQIIDDMIEAADETLELYDQALANGGELPEAKYDKKKIEEAVTELLKLRTVEADAKAVREKCFKEIVKYAETLGGDFTFGNHEASLKFTSAEPTLVTEPDEDTAAQIHTEQYNELLKAREQMLLLEKKWEETCAQYEHTRIVEGKSRLTVTAKRSKK